MINKELFVNTIAALQKQETHDMKCADAFQTILNEDRIVIGYDNGLLNRTIVNLLETIMNDIGEWIQYYIYELNYGKNYTIGCVVNEDESIIDISTSDKLYDFLIENGKKGL